MTFGPDDEEAFWAFREQLVEEFEAWLRPGTPVDSTDLGLLLDWKWGYGDGRLDRWERADLEEFLLDWCPRKLSAPPDLAAAVPVGVVEGLRFLADRDLLDPGSEPVERLAGFALSLRDRFLAAMADPGNFGMAKSIFGSMGIDDPTSLGPEGLQRAMDEFNALPIEERRRITDGPLAGPLELPTIGPVLLPDDQTVRAAADTSPLLARFDTLSDFFAAPGRNLTPAGNLTMADARALVPLLGTGEQEEVSYGDHTFRKRSATEFAELDHWQWWAREAGVLRRQGRRLVAVQAWRQRRRRDPLAELRRAVDVVWEVGLLRSYRPRTSARADTLLDAAVGPLLGALLSQPEGVDFDEIAAVWTDMLASAGYPPLYPGHVERALDETLTLLERIGLVTQSDRQTTPGLLGDPVRSGGTIRLTPLGVRVGVDLVAAEGVTVQTVPSPGELTAAALAGLAEDLDPVGWWAAAGGWLDSRTDPSSALAELVGQLAEANLAALILLLAEAPPPQRELLVPLLSALASRSTAITDELATVAYNWLLHTENLDPADADPVRSFDASLVTYGTLVESDPDVVNQLIDDGRDRSEHLGMLAAAGTRTSPRVLALLEAVGARHTDKVVAKAARKEAFRVRSRLAAPPR